MLLKAALQWPGVSSASIIPTKLQKAFQPLGSCCFRLLVACLPGSILLNKILLDRKSRDRLEDCRSDERFLYL